MNEDQNLQKNLVDTTDCLEAIGVFRGWKNFLFVIVILCLLLLQVSFWLVNTGYVKTDEEVESESSAVVAEDIEQINDAAKQVAAEPNQLTEAAPQQQQASPLFGITFKHLSWLIRFVNFVLIPTAILYCLTILFSLKVSLLGRLGGINHISRAFFLSLAFLVLLLPWQRFFGGVVAGAMYTPSELVRWYTVETTDGTFGIISYYLRFTGYWLLILLLLIFAQLRSTRWAKTILRRLEVV
jgi:hypothetical protein